MAALGPDAVSAHERALVRRLTEGLAAIDGVRTFRLWPADGDSAETDRIGVVTFTLDGYPAALVAQYLSAEHGIGVRDGRFCAHPLLARFAADGVTADGPASARAWASAAGLRTSTGCWPPSRRCEPTVRPGPTQARRPGTSPIRTPAPCRTGWPAPPGGPAAPCTA